MATPNEIFQARDTRFRDPFGAVTPHTPVHFRVCLPREWGCSACRLVMRRDGCGDTADGMFWAGMEGDDREWWECHYAPAAVGVYFYAFELELHGRRAWLFRRQDGGAERLAADNGRMWQITCYDPALTTPDWLAGGVMYQIFPDRFAASGNPKSGVPDDRVMREDWGGEPVWRPDAQGEVRNNDFFGGDLAGIEAHLDRLGALGVTCLYLNPIFESHSNHRYDTADYTAIDPLLGDEADFRSLCAAAHRRGIRVILDGVFSHTGADSRYFNQKHRYPEDGAYNSPVSRWSSWYHFDRWPDDYKGWWGFRTLPEVTETDPAFRAYINGRDGVVRRWLRAGADGWRLDVADELPDSFIAELRAAAKAEKPDALVLGEVWEDASNKTSYGVRRQYLLGQELDSVMNYPFRDAVLGFFCGEGAADFHNRVTDIVENYPPQVVRVLMNHIGTHDTERALTVLGGEPTRERGRGWQAAQRLSPEQREAARRRLMLAAVLQFGLPGVPCIYYGDEAGMEGYRDPFNRACYPWGAEDAGLLDWYGRLGAIRAAHPALREGAYRPLATAADAVGFARIGAGETVVFAVNRSDGERTAVLPDGTDGGRAVWEIGDGWCADGVLHLPPHTAAIVAWT